MRHLLRGLAALCIAAALAACSGSGWITGGELTSPGASTGTIQVINKTSNDLHAILISNCNANTYGLNRLPDDTDIPPGGTYNFTVAAGCWDVDAGTLGVGEARQRMRVTAGGITQYTVTD